MTKKNRRHDDASSHETHHSHVKNSDNQGASDILNSKVLLFAVLGVLLLVSLFSAFALFSLTGELTNLNSNIAKLANQAAAPTVPTQPTTPTQPTVEINQAQLASLPYIGSDDAPVVIVEFYDMLCSFCKRHAQETLPLIKQNYVDTGKVKYVFADFISVGASIVHEVGKCVREQRGDEAFFKFKEDIYANQSGISEELLISIALASGADETQLNTCIESGKYASEVANSGAYGRSLGISGTPGFIINGEFVSGAQPYSVFQQVIESKLAN